MECTSIMNLGNKEAILERFEKCFTIRDYITSFGLIDSCGNRRTFHRIIKIYKLEDFLSERKKQIQKNNIRNITNTNKIKYEDLFKKDSTYSRAVVKRRIEKDKLLDYSCAICGITGYWNNLPIILHLDHINGINNDHRLENLRFLCPNCHSQTATYCGRNKKAFTGSSHEKVPKKRSIAPPSSNTCVDCGTIISKGAQRCLQCSPKHPENRVRKVNRPSKETLEQEIRNNTFTKLGAKYGVSDNAVRKWCRYYDLPHRKKDIKNLK